jgi:HEAT repeat protein
MKCSKQEDYNVVDSAVIALMQLQKEPETVVPALLELLTGPNALTRSLTAVCLGGFGADAKAAVPLLLKALNDADSDVRDSAESALKEIDPKAPAQSQP